LGEEEVEPELESLPEGEAKRVQSEAVEPLLTVIERAELEAEAPAASVALAVREWEPLASEPVFKLKDQLEVPEALEKEPPSTESCTELRVTESEAVPETAMVPETVEPLEGEEMETEGEGEEMEMERLAEAE
jgi:hypothetical protein